MKELTKKQVGEILKKNGFDPRISWFYIQFKDKFEEEYCIDKIEHGSALNNLIKFLNKGDITEILFFPEPNWDFKSYGQEDIPSALLETSELSNFLKKNLNTTTNTHVADKDLRWIFTITHEGDFFISGTKALTKEFIKYYKDAKIMSRKELEAKQSFGKN